MFWFCLFEWKFTGNATELPLNIIEHDDISMEMHNFASEIHVAFFPPEQ